jgi:Xaa-Pro aminopeptidase
MEKHSIDALLLTQKENVIYFSGLRTITWGSKDRPIGVVVPKAKDKPVALIIPENLIEVAHHSSWIDKVCPWGGWRVKGIAADPITAFFDTCKSLCGDQGIIGLELGFDMRIGMSQEDFKDLQSRLSGFTMVDASSLLWDLRMIKSPLEIEALRKVCDATTKAFERGFSAIRPGMTERKLAGIIMSELALQTEELPGFVMVRSGKLKYGMVNVEPFEKPMEPGDIVVTDVGASYKYYCSDFMRMACIGKPSAEQRRIFNGELAAQQAGVDIIKPGIQLHVIFDACYNTLMEHGLKEHVPGLERVGHGVGLEFHEAPSIAKGSKVIVQPNMVLTVEPIFWDMPDHIHGNFAIEDMVLVTEKGHEVLSTFPKDLYIVE